LCSAFTYSPMDSSSFAYSFTSAPAAAPIQTPSPTKAVTREAHGVLPVTIKSLRAAAATSEKESFVIFGLPASKVIICGTVEEAEDLPANKLYTVTDLSGESVAVKDYSGYCPFAPKGSMVRIVGEVRTSEDQPFVSAIQLSPVSDQASLAYHMISATLAHCESTAGVQTLDFTPEKVNAPAASAQVSVKAEKLSESDLAAAVTQTLKSAGESGSPLDAIMRACAGNDVEIKAWIESSLESGQIFETGFGDSPHYATA